MSLKSSLIVLACFYFLLAFLCLLYLPNFDSFITEEEPPTKKKHRHIEVRDWLLSHCSNLTSPTARTVQSYELSNQFYFVSAYYDTRKDLSHFVRVLAAVRQFVQGGKRAFNLHCHVLLGPELFFTVPVTVYEMNENHARPFGAYIFSCPLPPHLQVSTVVCSVRITNGPDPVADPDGRRVEFVELPVLTVPQQPQRRQFTVCLPALFGSLSHTKLMDFVEMSRAVGAEHFVFYAADELAGQREVSRLLRQYQQRGIATVFSWKAVNRFRSLIHYHGQMLAVHHCLYWNMGLSKYVMFQDFDELLVPNQTKYDSWPKMMTGIDAGSHCGFRFFSAFFKPELGYFDAKRTSDVSRVRTKCMVRPELIFEMGIHHISKQNVEEMTPENKEPDTALLHHYKQCTTAFDTNPQLCKSVVRDSSLHFWKEKFIQLKRETVHKLNSL